jgi:hypothetical protein
MKIAKNVAKTNMVKDAWGNMIDINNVQIILTASMLKLWSSYKSVDDYISLVDKEVFKVSKGFSLSDCIKPNEVTTVALFS